MKWDKLGMQYAGQTIRSLNIRFGEHYRKIKNKKKNIKDLNTPSDWADVQADLIPRWSHNFI